MTNATLGRDQEIVVLIGSRPEDHPTVPARSNQPKLTFSLQKAYLSYLLILSRQLVYDTSRFGIANQTVSSAVSSSDKSRIFVHIYGGDPILQRNLESERSCVRARIPVAHQIFRVNRHKEFGNRTFVAYQNINKLACLGYKHTSCLFLFSFSASLKTATLRLVTQSDQLANVAIFHQLFAHLEHLQCINFDVSIHVSLPNLNFLISHVQTTRLLIELARSKFGDVSRCDVLDHLQLFKSEGVKQNNGAIFCHRNYLLLTLVYIHIDYLFGFVGFGRVYDAKRVRIYCHDYAFGSSCGHNAQLLTHIKASNRSAMLLFSRLVRVLPDLVKLEGVEKFDRSIESCHNQANVFHVAHSTDVVLFGVS